MLEYYKSVLTPHAFRQMESALGGGPSKFVDTFIRPFLDRSDLNSCIVLTNRKKQLRNKEHTDKVTKGYLDIEDLTFFTNPILDVSEGHALFNDVNARVLVNPFVTFTLEFDEGGVPFVEEQLGWLRGKARTSPMSDFFNTLRQDWHDLRGLTICYSGNKSFHYHFTFATDHLSSTPHPLDGFKRAWSILEDRFKSHFNVMVASDQNLRNTGMFRRIPNGSRILDKDNLFGVPAGELVIQGTLFESITTRAGYGAQSALLEDSLFATPLPTSRSASKAPPIGFATSAEIDYLEECIRDYFPDGEFPELAGLRFVGGEIEARFRNSFGDNHPASLMKADYATVGIMGSDPLGLRGNTDKRLPRPLGEMAQEWLEEFRNPKPKVQPIPPRLRLPLEEDFAKTVLTPQDAFDGVEKIVMSRALRQFQQPCLISAPEGISKTRGLLKDLHRVIASVMEWEREDNAGECNLEHSGIMLAFPTYEIAVEKMEELASLQKHGKRKLVPILVKSFNALYDDYLESDRSLKRIGFEFAAKHQFDTVKSAILRHQPEAMAFMRSYYEGEWARCAPRRDIPVYFTVHDVAHAWHQRGITRWMASRQYWVDIASPINRLDAYRETRIKVLVQDEVRPDQLLRIVPKNVYDYYVEFMDQCPAAKHDIERYVAFQKFSRNNPPPLGLDGRQLVYNEIKALDGFKVDGEGETKNSGEYGTFGSFSLYDAFEGEKWVYGKTTWPNQYNSIVLTAEQTPAHIARWRGDFETIELDCPKLKFPPATYKATPLRSSRVKALVQDIQDRHPDPNLMVISNKVADLDQTITHHSARGRNSFMAQNVVSVFTLMHPLMWSFYEAYNDILGRSDMVRLTHLDELNQTLGRNMGFRFRRGATHKVYINLRLHTALEPFLINNRYELVPDGAQSVGARKKARCAKPTPQQKKMNDVRRLLMKKAQARKKF